MARPFAMPRLITMAELLGRMRDLVATRREVGAPAEEIETLQAALGALSSVAAGDVLPEQTRLDGHLPAWWRDEEVRGAVVSARGHMKLDECVAMIRERFGKDRAPSRSSLHRAWMKLSGRRAPKPMRGA